MVTTEEKRELEKIRKQTNEPMDEEKIVPLIENKINIKDKKTKKVKTSSIQYKVVIPKKFASILKLDKEKHKVKFTLIKKEGRLLMEIING